jgi:hypothetical protein
MITGGGDEHTRFGDPADSDPLPHNRSICREFIRQGDAGWNANGLVYLSSISRLYPRACGMRTQLGRERRTQRRLRN